MREVFFGAMLLLAAALIVTGVALMSVPAGFVLSGVLLAGWSWLVLSASPPPAAVPAVVDDLE